MSEYVLTDVRIYVDKYDLSGDHNKLVVSLRPALLPCTTFGQTTEVYTPGGLWHVRYTGDGYMDFAEGEIDDVMDGKLGVADVPVTISPSGGASGERARIFKSLEVGYQFGGRVGVLLPFSVSIRGSTEAYHARVMYRGSPSGAGTSYAAAYELGAIATGQVMAGSLHVITAGGTSPTLDVIVQSSPTGTDSWTTRWSFTQAAAATSEFKTYSTAQTDTYWRVGYTLGGTLPAFTFIVSCGIA